MSWSFLLSYARQYTGLCVDSASIARGFARRAIICQPLVCFGCSAAGIRAGLCVSPPCSLTSFPTQADQTMHCNLADRPAAAERAAARVECIASALLACSQCVHVCARQLSSCACRARCVWTHALVPGARDSYARRRVRWCAACRTRRLCWRARSRDV